jgi:hypothetical protein
LRFFLEYLGCDRLDQRGKSFLRLVLKEACRKGRKRKFSSYGVADRLRQRPPCV